MLESKQRLKCLSRNHVLCPTINRSCHWKYPSVWFYSVWLNEMKGRCNNKDDMDMTHSGNFRVTVIN